MKRFYTLFLILLMITTWIPYLANAQEEDWMPDPNLRKAVRETQDIPKDVPLTIRDLQKMTGLVVLSSDISNLQGLDRAKNLEFYIYPTARSRILRPLRI